MKSKNNNFTVHSIPVLKDNIIWAWVKGNEAIVVDPAISEPVSIWLNENKLQLKAILQTHHHEDHIGGTSNLLKEWPSTSIIASKGDIERIPFQTISVTDGQTLNLLDAKVKILDVPGHTRNHIAFYLYDPSKDKKNPALFCGDTLFAAGCGRLFEGTPKQMFESLKRINSLPEHTKIYCAHEYTVSNLKWAKSIYPENSHIDLRLKAVVEKRKKGFLSLPSTLIEERKTNLFLQAKTSIELSKLRFHKDNWIS